MGAGTGFSARNARIRVNDDVVFAGYSWKAKMRSPKVDVTSFEDGGFMTVIGTILSAEVSAKGFWSAALNPMVAPSLIVPGTTLANVRFYLDLVGNQLAWFFPAFYVEDVDCDAEVRDGMKFDWNGCGDGIFYRPGTTPAP
jgi:hypothetical protein